MWSDRFRLAICMKNGLPYGEISVHLSVCMCVSVRMVNWFEKIYIMRTIFVGLLVTVIAVAAVSVAYEAYVINKEYSSGKLFSFKKVAHQPLDEAKQALTKMVYGCLNFPI